MESLKKQMADCEARWDFLYAQEMSSQQVLKNRAQAVDQWVVQMIQNSHKPSLWEEACVVALGGYGRQELNRYSDIDLMFLHSGLYSKDLEQLSADLCYPMWDAGLNVQATTRSLSDCLKILREDIRSQTALLELRCVWGHEDLFQSLQGALTDFWGHKRHQKKFVEAKNNERQARLAKFGDSIYILEPHVKEGEGGLRDYHYLRWMAAVFGDDWRRSVSEADLLDLERALHFVWKLRDAMHAQEKRRQDRLTFLLQESLASRLGFVGDVRADSPQQLIQHYYAAAATIHRICQRGANALLEKNLLSRWHLLSRKWNARLVFPGVHLVDDELWVRAEEGRHKDSLWGLELMLTAKEKKLRFSAESLLCLSPLAERITAADWQNEKAVALWRRLFQNPSGLGETLLAMHEMGWLTRWFPELAHLTHFAPRDAYHHYTVDIHTLKAIGEIGALGHQTTGEFAKAYRELTQPELLLWALLFHDAGKGLGAADHSEAGVDKARPCLIRLGFGDTELETILFLIRSHLVMPRIAFLRDLSDPHLVEKFVQSTEDAQKLALLYLISYADLKAVAPGVLTAWKQRLLTELYHGAHKLLSGTVALTPEAALVEKGDEVREHLGVEKTAPLKIFDLFPKNYLLKTAPLRLATLEFHYGQYQRKKPLFYLHHETATDSTHSELLLMTPDAPGLFSKMAGCLAAAGFNILDAQLHTTRDGFAIDWLSVQDFSGGPVELPDRWAELEGHLEAVLSGRLAVESLLEKRRSTAWVVQTRPSMAAPQIFLDNDISALYTVLEVHAADRVGLLYAMAHCLHGLSLNIVGAKISTEGSRVIDVFYLTDSKGHKIENKEHWGKVRECLTEALGQKSANIPSLDGRGQRGG